LTPLPLQNPFAMIHKSRIPQQYQRGRIFETAITNLTEWWSSTFFEVTFGGHIRNQTFDEVQGKLVAGGLLSQEKDTAIDLEAWEGIVGEGSERIRSPRSLMKHAFMQSGSRDTSAQLFAALCRGLGIPARLIVSLQSVPWQTGVGKPRPVYNKKVKQDEEIKGKEEEAENR
jgi:xeroderma pigmentosum group C-complementing protein